MKNKLIITSIAFLCLAQVANAVEGGTGAYTLGSRDLKMGIVPPHGWFLTNETFYQKGDVPAVSIENNILKKANVNILVNKTMLIYGAKEKFYGSRFAFGLTVPYAHIKAKFNLAGADVDTSQSGFADTILTPMFGWDQGKMHYNVSLNVFLPNGQYTNQTSRKGPTDILNMSKNKLALDPTISATYLDQNGLELNGSLGLTYNFKNQTTDYDSGTEMHLESSAAYNFKNGITTGLGAYAYTQLTKDKGTGADNLANTIGTNKINGRVFGFGPIVSKTFVFNNKSSLTLKARYFHEFGSKQRLESNTVFGTLTYAF